MPKELPKIEIIRTELSDGRIWAVIAIEGVVRRRVWEQPRVGDEFKELDPLTLQGTRDVRKTETISL